MSSAAAIIETLVQRLWDLQATHCAHVASSTIIVLDHLITLDDEIQLIWKSSWSLGKILFMFNRYFGLASVVVNLYGLFTPSLTDSLYVCNCYYDPIIDAAGLNYFRWQGATGVAVCVVSEIILLMRLYVLYLLNKRILIVMLVGFVISSGFAAAIMGLVMQRVNAVVVTLPGLKPMCVPGNVSSKFYTYWIPFLGFESLLCALALYRGFQTYRMDNASYTSSRLLIRILIRDSVMYYLAVFATYFTNMLMWAAAPPSLLELPIGFAVAVSCVLGNRMMFNIRQASLDTQRTKLPVRSPSSAGRNCSSPTSGRYSASGSLHYSASGSRRYSTPPVPRFTREVVTVRDGSVHREICYQIPPAVLRRDSVICLDTMRAGHGRGGSTGSETPSSPTSSTYTHQMVVAL
ncbi:hypothetical protein K523DRAFT_350195 [Schizophyllum commune Tattone D]|nr:hypothetical protein K523DRAFT_350195 [Schizophyllum commune Tattone D]